MEETNSRFRPSTPVNQPTNVIVTVAPTMNAVTTQAI